MDPRIRIYTQDKNTGAGAARNRAIKEARGEYILAVDGDDMLAPGALETLYGRAYNDKAEAVCGTLTYLSADGQMYGRFGPERAYYAVHPQTHPDLYIFAMGYHMAVLFKQDLIHRSKAKYSDHLRHAQDGYFLFDIFFHISVMSFIPDIIYQYRQTEHSLSRSECSPRWYAEDFAAYDHLYKCAIAHGRLDIADRRFGYRLVTFLAHDLGRVCAAARADRFAVFTCLAKLIRRYGIHQRNCVAHCLVDDSLPLRSSLVPVTIIQQMMDALGQGDIRTVVQIGRIILSVETRKSAEPAVHYIPGSGTKPAASG